MKRVAVITGGSRGIGLAVAKGLNEDGWTVVLAGRNSESLEKALSELSDDCSAVATDVSVESSVDKLFSQTVERHGRVDFVFNNAGIAAPVVPVDELDVDDFKKVIDINLTGAFIVARAAFKQMRNQSPVGGRIINNGSISATTPRPFSAPYTCSKHAITGLTKCLSLDGRPHQITCGQIDLGNISSDMGDKMAQGQLQADGSVKGEPTISASHVADALVYMANLPAEANVLSMTLMANEMPFVGRG